MSNLSIDISAAVKKATKKWKEEKRKADKNDRLYSHQYQRFYEYSDRVTVREVAFDIMEAAYNHASSNGKYYANARQIMYAARPEILKRTGRAEVSKNGKTTYFTQTLLKDYLEEKNPPWKIAWDARGHIIEPHTDKMIGLGGIEVEQYIYNWHGNIKSEVIIDPLIVDTDGPENRYKNALFIEKEGFTEIITDAGFPEIYDMALMSTKGMPVKAACDLIYKMDLKGVRVFVLHDFDYSGFKILKTLRDGVRLSRGTEVIDLGLRMEDIKGLPSEPVHYKQTVDPGYYLGECGCTVDEINFLVDPGRNYNYHGQRVEINAMTSEQLVQWLHKKFTEHGVKKYIPEQDKIIETFRHAKKLSHIDTMIKVAERNWDNFIKKEGPISVPEDLTEQLNSKLYDHPELSWDEAIWNIVNQNGVKKEKN